MKSAICLAVALFASAMAPIPAQAQALPGVVEVQTGRVGKPLVIFWSGDGGWHHDLDAKMGAELAGRGFDVVGLDTNVWFSSLRTRVEAGRKLAELIAHYGRTAPGRRIIVMGWSFGADVLPIAFNNLPDTDKQAISALVLLAVSRSTTMQVTLASRTGLDPGDVPVMPELARLPRDKLICVYNTHDSATSGCLGPATSGASVIHIPGDHSFDHDAKGVVDRLLPLMN